MTEWTNIRISKELHRELATRGTKMETYDETISRLIGFTPDKKQPDESVTENM
jgi:hypothetical protein